MTRGTSPASGDAETPSPAVTEARSGCVRFAFPVALAGFVAASALLARGNNSPGSADSCGNLVAARNIVLGRGFVATAAGNLWVAEPLPSPETMRAPGLPVILAAAFAAAGVSLAVPVAVNALGVALNALLLRAAVGRAAGRGAGDVAGLLVLLSYDYEMVSIWNNNLLAACVSALLLIVSPREGGGRRGWLPVGLATVSAFGFLLKQSFVLSAVPFALMTLAASEDKLRRRATGVVVYLALLAGLTSVYWGPNLLRTGRLVDSQANVSGRLEWRYGVLGPDTFRTLRFGKPMTYGEVARTLGVANMLIVDAKTIAKTVFYTICMNPAVAALAAALGLFRRPGLWRDYAGAVVLAAGAAFEVGVYHHHEFRYLWPIYPCLLYLAALTARDFEGWGAPG